jgi:nucleotide-binding universal stress UspA family protein
MFSTLVWATDGSEHADRALGYATQIADREHARLHVVHIVEKIVGGRVAGQNAFLNEDELDAKINAQAQQVSAEHGIPTTVHMTPSGTGNIADRIADIATDAGADLIVVGTRGHSAIAELLLGSVTQRLMHVVSCPVLAVPPVRAPHTQPSEQPPAATTAS